MVGLRSPISRHAVCPRGEIHGGEIVTTRGRRKRGAKRTGAAENVSLKQKVGPDFRRIFTTRSGMAKRIVPFDSAHKICLFTFSQGVLIVVRGPSSLN